MNARDPLTREAVYLVLDFLRSGPCSVSAETFAAEAQRIGLLPQGASETELRDFNFAANVPKGFLLGAATAAHQVEGNNQLLLHRSIRHKA